MKSFLPYGRQSISEQDVAAVVDALCSDLLTTGPLVEAFEQALAEYCGAKHAVAVANGTAALHLAVMAADLKPNQRLLTSANTFLASGNCAEFVGGMADFADIDSQSYNVSADTLQAAWKDDVRAVVAVDFAGQPCDMPRIAALAHSRGAVVIEDASHSLGSEFNHAGVSYRVGGHPWADMTTLSFHPVKTLTTGEGGAILTNDDRLAERCRRFRTHGMVKEPNDFDSPVCETGPWYYEMPEVGFNYRITDIQCALGLSQIRRLDSAIKRRAEIVRRYNEAFGKLAHVQSPRVAGVNGQSSRIGWHLYVLQIDFPAVGKTRAQVMQELREAGVGTQVHYIPVHLQPYYRRKYGYGVGKCPVAEAYYQRCLSLPLYPGLSDQDVQRVIDSIAVAVSR